MTIMKKEEFEFRDLLNHPWKLFGYSYLYVLVILGGLGLYYISQLTMVGKNNILPSVSPDSVMLVQDIPMQPAASVPPVDMRKVGAPTTQLISRGREVFRASCVGCHGETGNGDGSAGATLNPPPRNFRKPDGWVNGSKVSQIYRTLQEGIVRTGMSSFNYLPPDDRFALAHYIRTVVPVPPADSPDDMIALESTYQLSKGSTTPAQIPIRIAMRRITDEFRTESNRLRAAITKIKTSDAISAHFFKSHVADEQKAAGIFLFCAKRMENVDVFERIVASDPPGSGFRPSVVMLSKDEWKLLFDFGMSL